MLDYLVIFNPAAKDGKAGKQFGELEALLGRLPDVQYRIERTSGQGHATELAKRAVHEGCGFVVVAGGDGTVNEVVNGLIHENNAVGGETGLGVLCLGAGNDFAKAVNVDSRLAESVPQLLRSKAVYFDVGKIFYSNSEGDYERYFCTIAGIGLNAVIAAEKRFLQWKRVADKAFYLRSLVAHLGDSATKLSVCIDDGEIREYSLLCMFAGNTYCAGGGMKLNPNADCKDGKLEAIVVKDIPRHAERWALVPRLITGSYVKHEAVVEAKCGKIAVCSDEELPLLFDGEVTRCRQAVFTAEKGRLKVLVPY